MVNSKWNKDIDNGDSVIWSNISDKANLRVIAKRFDAPVNNMEWEVRPEIDGRLGPDIRVPNKEGAIDMISEMKKLLSAYLKEAIKTGKTFKETVKIMNETVFSDKK